MVSPDGTRIAAPTSIPTITDGAGAVFCIGYGGWVQRNGVNTTGHALQLLWHGGALYALSPNAAHWWRYLGPNSWRDLGTADPAAVTPPRRGYVAWARMQLLPGPKAIAAGIAESVSAAAAFIGSVIPAALQGPRVYLSWTELRLP